jgi:hypothetical protein
MNEVLYRMCIGLLLMVFFAGCGDSRSGYPDVSEQIADGKQNVCHQCGKRIEIVGSSNRITLGAAQYLVCSEDCQKTQQAWHESRFGKTK